MRRYARAVPLACGHDDADEEVSMTRDAAATHVFDDPVRQRDPANAAARADAVERVTRGFMRHAAP
jgi:hypothetical protein